jgi:hypothetical protein
MGLKNRESDVLAGCLLYLKLKGVWCWRQNQGAIPLAGGGYRRFNGLKGLADILGILPCRLRVGEGEVTIGRLLAVEVKRPGGKARPEQEEFLAKVNELGGLGLCVRSVAELEQQLTLALAG